MDGSCGEVVGLAVREIRERETWSGERVEAGWLRGKGDGVADREQVWDLMREKWEGEVDLTESRRGLFALAYTRDDDRLQVLPPVPLNDQHHG